MVVKEVLPRGSVVLVTNLNRARTMVDDRINAPKNGKAGLNRRSMVNTGFKFSGGSYAIFLYPA